MSFSDNLRKTVQYCRRNGVRETWYAAAERLKALAGPAYVYEEPSGEALRGQRDAWAAAADSDAKYPLITFLVPVYEPDPQFMTQMLQSVLAQTWQNFEVVIADASRSDTGRNIVRSMQDSRIHWNGLSANGGISANTNAAADKAAGDYVALLDYDDLLTPDAVYEITQVIMRENPEIIYSDEDKCDDEAKRFFEVNRKPDFNPDYLLANNYICHLLVMKRELFLALRLRSRFDGAQDYDLMLRAPWSGIRHIPRVLYHWRTHKGSTAGNPGSKSYAYEAGKAALEEYLRTCRIKAVVEHARHRGFYNIKYQPDIFHARKEVGVVGGKLVNARRRIVGGMMDENGKVIFAGMHEMESGPMHRADTRQDCYAVDVRCMQIREELHALYRSVFQASYDTHIMYGEEELVNRSIEFCRKAAQMGYLIVWDPSIVRQI